MSSYSATEERWHATTHGIGAAVAAFLAPMLIAPMVLAKAWPAVISCSVFVISLLLLLVASTLYHQAPTDQLRARRKIWDHCAIFLLIAGTYTPFSLIPLRDQGGITLLIVVWSLAIAGITFKLFFTGRFKLLSTLIYLVMGWLVIAKIQPLLAAISLPCRIWLFIGGAAYTLGAVIYLMKSVRYTHLVWHIMVLIGAFSHFSAVWLLFK
jgi:hemolysin III